MSSSLASSKLGEPTLPGRVHWRWVVLPGILVACAALALWAVTVGSYGLGSHLLGGGEEGWTRVERFGEQGRWAVPALAGCLTGVAGSWVGRRVAECPETHGGLIGVVAGLTTVLALGAIHGWPGPLTLLGAVGIAGAGWLGGREARSAAATLRAMYQASRAIALARSRQEIVTALGVQLEQDRVVYVGLWEAGEDARGNLGERGIRRSSSALAEWHIRDRTLAPPDAWLAEIQTALNAGSTLSSVPIVLRKPTMTAGANGAPRIEGPRSALLLPVHGVRPGDRAVVLIGSGSPYVFDRHRATMYVPLASQVAAAIERVTLVDQGRQIGSWNERQRLARDIHDAVKQQVFALELQVAAARALLETDPVKADLRLEEAGSLIRQVQTELVTVIQELQVGPSVQGQNLVAHVRQMSSDWSQRSAIPVEVTIDGEKPTSQRYEQAIVRIAQEALANAARHSGASVVSVGLKWTRAAITLSVTDDGCGFDLSDVDHVGYGLTSMRERVTQLGGSYSIESGTGSGTGITCQLPLTDSDDVAREHSG